MFFTFCSSMSRHDDEIKAGAERVVGTLLVDAGELTTAGNVGIENGS
jgi:hypothetical protein